MMHSLLPYLLLLPFLQFAIAVPSATNHFSSLSGDGRLRLSQDAEEEQPQSQVDTKSFGGFSVDGLLDSLTSQPRHSSGPRKPGYIARLRSHIIDAVWSLVDSTEDKRVEEPPAFTVKTSPSRQILAQYGNELVLRFNVTNQEEAASLAEAADILFLDVWASGEGWTDLRIAKDVLPSLLGLLPDSLQRSHKAILQGNELAEAVAATYPLSISSNERPSSPFAPISSTSKHCSSTSNVFFDDYQPLGVIDHWMQLLQSIFPTHVRVITVGSTYEGRPIKALRLGVHPTNDERPLGPRNTIIITGGQHAREWISVSTVNYAAYAFTTSYAKDPLIQNLLQKLDLIFVPTVNPDGYQYSFDYDRLWRKNRQPTSLNFCPGVDLDRCWNFHWDGQRTIDNPCSESFAGNAPFDSVESRSFSGWVKNETRLGNMQVVGFLDLHSYSQQILFPYSFSCQERPPTAEDLEEMGNGLAKAIRGNSHINYKVKSACEGSVAVSGTENEKPRAFSTGAGGGSALDWFYHEMGVRKSFQIKLRDQGVYGFLLPREYIVPTGSEILGAIEWFATQVALSMAGAGIAPSAQTDERITQQALTDNGDR